MKKKKEKVKTVLDRAFEKPQPLVIELQVLALQRTVQVLQDQIDEIKVQLLHVVFYPESEAKNEG